MICKFQWSHDMHWNKVRARKKLILADFNLVVAKEDCQTDKVNSTSLPQSNFTYVLYHILHFRKLNMFWFVHEIAELLENCVCSYTSSKLVQQTPNGTKIIRTLIDTLHCCTNNRFGYWYLPISGTVRHIGCLLWLSLALVLKHALWVDVSD